MLIKTKEEVKQLERGGKILGGILSRLAKMAKAGVSTAEIDEAAEKMIIKAGGRPSFKGYTSHHYDPPYPCTICASRNHEIVHGIARADVILADGDNLGIDIGMEWPHKKGTRGYFTDTAMTVAVGKIDDKHRELLRVTRAALEMGIKAARPGCTVADIGRAIEDYVRSQGKYGIIRDLVGHGVGHEVHEEPRVPNYYDRALERWVLKSGMVLALEPMITLGGHNIQTAADQWTIETADGSLCAHFEHTLVITKTGCRVLTRRPGERWERI